MKRYKYKNKGGVQKNATSIKALWRLGEAVFSWNTFLLSCNGWLSQEEWKSQVQPQLASEGIAT